MKTSKTTTRLQTVSKKIEKMTALLNLAKKGLSQANKGNPYWTKREAMKSINFARTSIKQLENIYLLEYSIK